MGKLFIKKNRQSFKRCGISFKNETMNENDRDKYIVWICAYCESFSISKNIQCCAFSIAWKP